MNIHEHILIWLAMFSAGMGGYIIGRLRCRKCEARYFKEKLDKEIEQLEKMER